MQEHAMPQTEPSRPMFRLAACVVALGCLLTPPADAQSDASLRQSEASLRLLWKPGRLVAALAQGGELVVSGVAASGTVVAVTVPWWGSASFVVYLRVEA